MGIQKPTHMLAPDRLNELIDQLKKVHKDDQFNRTEAEEKQCNQGQSQKNGTFRAVQHK